jgi:GNAT superfamily N-acetyltransferase
MVADQPRAEAVGLTIRVGHPECRHPELSGQWSQRTNGVLSEDGVVPPHIRLAELSDVPDITECYLRSWRAAYAADLEPEALVVEAEKRRSFDWARGIGEDSTGVFVASDHRGLLGVVQSNLSLPPPRNLPEITMLYVDPRAWGTGAANALLEAGTDWIRHKDHAAARLRVVESHHRARRFYEREGWILDDGIAPAANDLFRLIYYRRTLTS